MLANATVSKLCELGLSTMAEALADQLGDPGRFADLAFEDRLGRNCSGLDDGSMNGLRRLHR